MADLLRECTQIYCKLREYHFQRYHIFGDFFDRGSPMGFFGFLGSFMGDFVGDGGSFFPQELLCPLLAFALTLSITTAGKITDVIFWWLGRF